MVDEELVEVGSLAYPSEPEEAWRRSGADRGNEPGKVSACEGSCSPFGEAAPPTGQDEPGACEAIEIAQRQVRGEVPGHPRREQGWCVGAELIEQVAQLCSLSRVEEGPDHGHGV